MNSEELWAQFVKTGAVSEYLAYKNACDKPQGECADASVNGRVDNKGEYSGGE